MDGWETSFLWGWGYFQGRFVSFREKKRPIENGDVSIVMFVFNGGKLPLDSLPRMLMQNVVEAGDTEVPEKSHQVFGDICHIKLQGDVVSWLGMEGGCGR